MRSGCAHYPTFRLVGSVSMAPACCRMADGIKTARIVIVNHLHGCTLTRARRPKWKSWLEGLRSVADVSLRHRGRGTNSSKETTAQPDFDEGSAGGLPADAPDEKVPIWATSGGGFTSVTRTIDELSVVCAENAIPQGTKCGQGWRIFKIEGPLDFTLTGILVSVAKPLADAGVSTFAVSTYDTRLRNGQGAERREEAARALASAGHRVKR